MGLIFVNFVPFGFVNASVSVAGIIESDVTWTKANSPYVLAGNVLIAEGVTLTIESGVTVNMGNFFIMVNGTLRAQGSSSDRIMLNGGYVWIREFSPGWNNQTGAGNIVENAMFTNSSLYSDASLKASNNFVNGSLSAAASSLVTNNNVTNELLVFDSTFATNNIATKNAYGYGPCLLSSNTVGDLRIDSSATASNNTITGGVTNNDATLTNNIISGNVSVNGGTVSHNIISGNLTCGESAMVSFNDIGKGVFISTGTPTILNNTVKSGDIGINLSPSFANASIINNTITARNIGINIVPSFNFGIVAAGKADAYISGNTIYNCSVAAIKIGGSTTYAGGVDLINNAIINNNLIFNNSYGIQNGGNANIEGNTISFNNYGVDYVGIARNNIIANNSIGIGYAGTIEGNLIVNNRVGITTGSIIRNNTIARNTLAINGSFTTLTYNNIQDNTNNIRYSSSSNADASNNWWGTTNTAAINQTIYDYKNDFTLGRVDFVPMLTAPNPSAPSANTPIPPPIVIPELQTPMLIAILLIATLAITVGRLIKKKR